jgi:hypothetical protein
LQEAPSILPRATYKRVGDALCSAVTHDPFSLAKIVTKEKIVGALDGAVAAYAHAQHYAPWMLAGWKDFGGALSIRASVSVDADAARRAVAILLGANADVVRLASALMVVAKVADSEIVPVARSFLSDMSTKLDSDKEQKLVVYAMLAACDADACSDTSQAGLSAIAALRVDPADWRAWNALGIARESDGSTGSWTDTIIKSTIDAWTEADRLGGGPDVSQFLSTSLERRIKCRNEDHVDLGVASEAAAANALSCRAGNPPLQSCREAVSTLCRRGIDGAIAHLVTEREEIGVGSRYRALVSRSQHTFPWISQLVAASEDGNEISYPLY